MSNNLESIAKQFLEAYYTTIMSNRNNLISFYNNQSSMDYNGSKFRGLKEIG